MLRKLIKYDMKYLNRFLIMIHAFMLAAVFFIRVLLPGRAFAENSQDAVILTLVVILLVILLMAATFATALIITVRFYKNLFSDEGYLTRTLPVTGGQHLLAKTIAGSLWSCIDALLIFFSIYCVFSAPYLSGMLEEVRVAFIEEYGISPEMLNSFMIAVVAVTLLGAVSNVIFYYASVAVGQLLPGHKILGAIAAYFVIGTVMSIAATLILAVFGLFSADFAVLNPFVYTMDTLKISVALTLVMDVVLYVVTYYVMTRKVELA